MKIAGIVSSSGYNSGHPGVLVPGRNSCVEKNKQTVQWCISFLSLGGHLSVLMRTWGWE